METEVYADLYFLINFCMDCICIMIAGILLHRKLTRVRVLFASAFGASFALAALLLPLDGVLGFLLEVCAGLLLSLIAFYTKKQPIGKFIRIFAAYMLICTLMGGIMTALYSWLNQLNLPFEEVKEESISTWLFALLALAAGVLTLRGGRWLGFSEKQKTVQIKLSAFGKERVFTAFVDSGNLLRDPVSGKSVIVIDKKALKGFLPEEFLLPPTNSEFQIWLSNYKNAKKVRFIPIKTANAESIMVAFLPDKIEIKNQKESYSADYLVAAGEAHPFGDCNALISME